MSNWGKLLEDVLIARLKDEHDEIIGMPPHQFAYRKGHSCTHVIDLLNCEIEEAQSRSRNTLICAMDLTKAFDSV